jgi:hypothetical protein
VIRERRLTYLAATMLIVLGGVILLWRWTKLHDPSRPHRENIWRLSYDISFPRVPAGRSLIAIPDNTQTSRVFRESFSRSGIWMDILHSKADKGREAVIAPLAGFQRGRFLAEFDIQVTEKRNETVSTAKKKLTADTRAYYLRPEKHIQLQEPQVQMTLSALTTQTKSRDKLLENIFTYCAENILTAPELAPSDALGALEQNSATILGRVRAMAALCRAAKYPARIVTGFILEDNVDAQPHFWLEVFQKDRWRPYDPENHYARELPAAFIPLRRDDEQMITMKSEMPLSAKYSLERLVPGPATMDAPEYAWEHLMDLTRLPPSMQQILTLLLLLPVGALITAVFRNLIGIQTFGTFAPALIALSFIQADWRTGMVVFLIVIGIGITARYILNALKLLMVARLSIILTLVVLCMILCVSILDYLGLTPSASAVLLPTVILTVMIERFNIIAEEDSHREALKIFAFTLLVALACLLLLRLEIVGRTFLLFPELLLFNMAALLFIGRYAGYRLSELWRFRDLGVPHDPQ